MSQTTIQRLKTFNSLFLFRISLLSFHCLLTLFDSVRMCVFIPKKETERFVRCASSAFRKPIIEIHRFIMTFSEHCCMVSSSVCKCVSFVFVGCIFLSKFRCHAFVAHCSNSQKLPTIFFFFYLNTRT